MSEATFGKSDQVTNQQELDTSGMSFTGRIAGWSAKRRWRVILASILLLASAFYVLSKVETKMYDGDGGEGDSAFAADLISERFENDDSAPVEQLVFSNLSLNANDPAYQATVQTLVDQLRALPEVASVESYYDTGIAGMLSTDEHVILARVELIKEGEAKDNIVPVLDTVHAAADEAAAFEISIAGNTSLNKEINEIMEEDFKQIMLVTMILGLGILLIVFRAVVAALVPLVIAIGSIFAATALAALLSQTYALADSYSEMILLMGMAVGIDYSLFIMSRFRSERKLGKAKLQAIASASDTTGRAVFYAGVTVVLSLGGLILTNNPIFISLAAAAIIVVLVAMVASLTLLPALLGALGDKINWLRPPYIGRESTDDNGGIWGTITDKVLARPAVLATTATLGLLALALPVVSLNLGFNSGADALPTAASGRRAVELLEEHFTSGLLGPAVVVVDSPNVNSAEVQAYVSNLIETVGQDSSFFEPFRTRTNEAGDLMIITVPVIGDIDDEVSEGAITHLREDVIPTVFAGSDTEVYVTGQTAGSMDFKNHMYDSAPIVFTFVLGLAFLLLLVMFRSIIIPIKAIILNLLSVGAAYGVLVMIFQYGWGISVLGSEATGVIEAWLPLFLFGILFGLSMDYHMLLLNRIKEAHDQGKSNDEAVSTGIRVTAGQITGAALIMVGVFGAFAMGRIIGFQQFGVGLGVAVLIDATVIRSVLLPASMKLLGDRNWYLPTWLEWLPRISPEGETVEQPAQTPQPEYGIPSASPQIGSVTTDGAD
jgi:uncharacterized membrane protein YdfJ with MMPL/SSD domain